MVGTIDPSERDVSGKHLRSDQTPAQDWQTTRNPGVDPIEDEVQTSFSFPLRVWFSVHNLTIYIYPKHFKALPNSTSGKR
jgi:hypothetical protein